MKQQQKNQIIGTHKASKSTGFLLSLSKQGAVSARNISSHPTDHFLGRGRVPQSSNSNTAEADPCDCLFPGVLAAASFLTTPSSVTQNFL